MAARGALRRRRGKENRMRTSMVSVSLLLLAVPATQAQMGSMEWVPEESEIVPQHPPAANECDEHGNGCQDDEWYVQEHQCVK